MQKKIKIITSSHNTSVKLLFQQIEHGEKPSIDLLKTLFHSMIHGDIAWIRMEYSLFNTMIGINYDTQTVGQKLGTWPQVLKMKIIFTATCPESIVTISQLFNIIKNYSFVKPQRIKYLDSPEESVEWCFVSTNSIHENTSSWPIWLRLVISDIIGVL
jgi:hypothetical protein